MLNKQLVCKKVRLRLIDTNVFTTELLTVILKKTLSNLVVNTVIFTKRKLSIYIYIYMRLMIFSYKFIHQELFLMLDPLLIGVGQTDT